MGLLRTRRAAAFLLLSACSMLALLRPPVASGQMPLPAAARKAPLLFGAAWYPEQWPEARWDADLDLMQAAHVNVVRIGEFAWSTMEPSEGTYNLDWLDRAIRAAERHHIAVILGTPTAAPPAWLTSKYPETLRTIQATGRKDTHGDRQQFDWSDPTYRRFAGSIALAMAKRFGHDPNVIAWQIDNEYKNESYGPEDLARFQAWLHAKYKTLENLNTRWTTAYWSETYQDWSQIPYPGIRPNPGLFLNWKEFISETWRSYQKVQLDVIRANAEPRQQVTTNTMGWFDAFDHYTVEQDLDFAAWDNYVGTGHLDPVANGIVHDLTRGYLRRNFWVIETQPGSVNWSAENNDLDKGEVRAMAWNAIGHGAECVEYWQWRAALNGQEQYHGTLVGADGTPMPLYEEVQQIGAEFQKAGPALAGTTVESQVAILNDFPSRWAINEQRFNAEYNPITALNTYYAPLKRLVRSVDVVSDVAPLSRYKLVVAPALNVLTPQAAENLVNYVRGGGHLVLGQRSGLKDEDNSLQVNRQPGPLVDLLGARVEKWYSLEHPIKASGVWGDDTDAVWAELLGVRDPGVEVLMRYGKSNGWLDGQPAAVTRTVGKGRITYIGAALDTATMKTAAAWMLTQSGLKAIMPQLPATVDLSIRSGSGKRIYILTNYGEQPATISLPGAMNDVLTGGSVRTVTLPHFGVAVLAETQVR